MYLYLQECNEIISVLPYTEISASSHKNSKRRKSCMPDMGGLDSSKGWCPRKQNGKEYIFNLNRCFGAEEVHKNLSIYSHLRSWVASIRSWSSNHDHRSYHSRTGRQKTLRHIIHNVLLEWHIKLAFLQRCKSFGIQGKTNNIHLPKIHLLQCNATRKW